MQFNFFVSCLLTEEDANINVVFYSVNTRTSECKSRDITILKI